MLLRATSTEVRILRDVDPKTHEAHGLQRRTKEGLELITNNEGQ